jgi:hypothetical protein
VVGVHGIGPHRFQVSAVTAAARRPVSQTKHSTARGEVSSSRVVGVSEPARGVVAVATVVRVKRSEVAGAPRRSGPQGLIGAAHPAIAGPTEGALSDVRAPSGRSETGSADSTDRGGGSGFGRSRGSRSQRGDGSRRRGGAGSGHQVTSGSSAAGAGGAGGGGSGGLGPAGGDGQGSGVAGGGAGGQGSGGAASGGGVPGAGGGGGGHRFGGVGGSGN